MPIESAQCPSCGAALQLEPGAKIAVCDYCHTNLRITKGASGHPLAVLGSISVDTGILAREAAYRRLEERLAGLLAAMKQCEESLEPLTFELAAPLAESRALHEEISRSKHRLQQLQARPQEERDLERKREDRERRRRAQSTFAGKMVLVSGGLAIVLALVDGLQPVAAFLVLPVIVGIVWNLILSASHRDEHAVGYEIDPETAQHRRVAELEAKLERLLMEKPGLRSEFEQLERRRDDLNSEIERVRGQMAKMKAEIDDLTEEL